MHGSASLLCLYLVWRGFQGGLSGCGCWVTWTASWLIPQGLWSVEHRFGGQPGAVHGVHVTSGDSTWCVACPRWPHVCQNPCEDQCYQFHEPHCSAESGKFQSAGLWVCSVHSSVSCYWCCGGVWWLSFSCSGFRFWASSWPWCWYMSKGSKMPSSQGQEIKIQEVKIALILTQKSNLLNQPWMALLHFSATFALFCMHMLFIMFWSYHDLLTLLCDFFLLPDLINTHFCNYLCHVLTPFQCAQDFNFCDIPVHSASYVLKTNLFYL